MICVAYAFFNPVALRLFHFVSPQPSLARQGSFWRCRLRSVPSAQQEATRSAVASASTSGIPCLLDLVAWQPPWKTAPVRTTGSPATGLSCKMQ